MSTRRISRTPPPGQHYVTVAATLEPGQARGIDRLAALTGQSKSFHVRRAVARYLADVGADPAAAGDVGPLVTVLDSAGAVDSQGHVVTETTRSVVVRTPDGDLYFDRASCRGRGAAAGMRLQRVPA